MNTCHDRSLLPHQFVYIFLYFVNPLYIIILMIMRQQVMRLKTLYVQGGIMGFADKLKSIFENVDAA